MLSQCCYNKWRRSLRQLSIETQWQLPGKLPQSLANYTRLHVPLCHPLEGLVVCKSHWREILGKILLNVIDPFHSELLCFWYMHKPAYFSIEQCFVFGTWTKQLDLYVKWYALFSVRAQETTLGIPPCIFSTFTSAPLVTLAGNKRLCVF